MFVLLILAAVLGIVCSFIFAKGVLDPTVPHNARVVDGALWAISSLCAAAALTKLIVGVLV